MRCTIKSAKITVFAFSGDNEWQQNWLFFSLVKGGILHGNNLSDFFICSIKSRGILGQVYRRQQHFWCLLFCWRCCRGRARGGGCFTTMTTLGQTFYHVDFNLVLCPWQDLWSLNLWGEFIHATFLLTCPVMADKKSYSHKCLGWFRSSQLHKSPSYSPKFRLAPSAQGCDSCFLFMYTTENRVKCKGLHLLNTADNRNMNKSFLDGAMCGYLTMHAHTHMHTHIRSGV